ncbi:2-acyl-glycerophospho-ethanolamine acyltransferase [compost metagenome]
MSSPEQPQVEVAQGGFGPVLANPSFLVLWLGQVFSQTADKLVFILLVSIVGEQSSSSTHMSIALALHAMPNVLFGAVAGVLVDRWDKRWVMIITNAGRAAFVIALGAFGHQSLAIAIGLAFLIACFSQPFIPAEGATIPLVVKREQLLQANSLFATTMIGSVIVAFTLGEPLIQWVGSRNAAWVVGGAFFASVVFIYFVRYNQADQRSAHGAFMDQLKSGFGYIRRTRVILHTLFQQVALFAMFAAMSVLAIIFAKNELKTNFSWFLASAGVGMAIGSWVLGHYGLKWNKSVTVVTGFLLSGVVLSVLAFLGADHLVPAFVVAVLLGFSSSLVAVPLQTRLQELTPEHLRGKVFGAQNMVLNIATTIPIAAAGFLVDALGLRVVILSTAILMAVAGVLTWLDMRVIGTAPDSAAVPEPAPAADEGT